MYKKWAETAGPTDEGTGKTLLAVKMGAFWKTAKFGSKSRTQEGSGRKETNGVR